MQKPVYISLLLLLCSCGVGPGPQYADHVDMMMGQMGESNCVVGPQLPHGSVNPSPQTPFGENDGYDPGQPIRGFGQLHVSGIGWGRYGQLLISPQRGFDPSEEGHDSPKSDEVALPYYYAVTLDRYRVRTELAPTHNAVSYRFTFMPGKCPEGTESNILMDMTHSIPQHIKPEIGGRFHGGSVDYDNNAHILSGWGEYSGGFGDGSPYKVYFSARLDVMPESVDVVSSGDSLLYAKICLGDFDGVVNMDIGISMRSLENAVKFRLLQTEGKTIEEISAEGAGIWNSVLSSVEISGESTEKRRIFYTALYHSFLMPRDRTGDNPGWNGDRPHFDDHYCVWDTWRTKFPLMILLDGDYVAANINSFIDRFNHNGMVRPSYTSSMDFVNKQGGDDVDNIIADAIIKGLSGFDMDKAYEVIKHNALKERSPAYLSYGWEPDMDQMMSCSYGLGYAYNDYCAYRVAAVMGDYEFASQMLERSGNWEEMFNAGQESDGFYGFISPRRADGEWIGFDPAVNPGSWKRFFYEANSWVYSLFVPHSFDRLIELCGGEEKMVERLCYGFENDLIDMGNEPGFLAPFIFSHCGRPDLTARYVQKIRDNAFSLETGYPGNDDSGAMGSWYVFTSLGFFPNAGQDFYYLVPPAFESAVVHLSNGNEIEIKTNGHSGHTAYITGVQVDGQPYRHTWISHETLTGGCTIHYELGSEPKDWFDADDKIYRR